MDQITQTPPETISQAEEWVTKGENLLLKGRFSQGLSSFDKAKALIEDSQGEFYFRMGLALFEFGSEEGRDQALLLATKKFKVAVSLSSEPAEILQAWGSALTLLGDRTEEHHYYLSAKERYEQALGFGAESADLFWNYANIWTQLALHSGEAYDYQRALQFFERAADERESMPNDFWIDFGTCALELSTIIRDPRQIVRAVNAFKHAASIDSSHFDAMCSLAEALDALYDQTHDDDHFTQAHEAYSNASKLSPQDAEVWLSWAQFLLNSAKRNRDLKRLRLCLEKCHYAYARDGENPLILGTWAEALALLGEMTERLDLIYEAENKIAEALEREEGDPSLWLSLGMCMNSFARYFSDNEHYYLAIEKFQKGLSIDRSFDPLWHEIAKTYACVGALDGNTDTLVQALKFFEKALHFKETAERHIDYAKALSKIGEMTHSKGWFEQSLYHFEVAFSMQKNAIYLHPEWLFYYATTLDMVGDYHEEEAYYTKAIEIFSHVIMVDPDFQGVHHHLAQAYSHLGELKHEADLFYRAIHHLRLALKRDEDNDALYLDWGIALINIAQVTPVFTDVDQLYSDAKDKLTLAAKLGNPCAYYQLCCLFSLLRQYDESLFFLYKAHSFDALPSMEEMLCDDWLDNLRTTTEFRQFLSQHPHLSEDR